MDKTKFDIIKRISLEAEEDWKIWIDKIPYIKFPSAWEVQIIPPIVGAMARFRIKYKNAIVSVYLDVYEVLGYFGKPYWEVYPVSGDNLRVDMNDIEGLLKIIKKSIRQQNKK